VSDPVAVAREAWSGALPDWVLKLAEECARTSQSKVAALLGRSPALVSNVLHRKYPGDMTAVEDLVRGRFMRATVQCPANGEISSATCRDWIVQSRTYANTNSERVRMYNACRRCPRAGKDSVK